MIQHLTRSTDFLPPSAFPHLLFLADHSLGLVRTYRRKPLTAWHAYNLLGFLNREWGQESNSFVSVFERFIATLLHNTSGHRALSSRAGNCLCRGSRLENAFWLQRFKQHRYSPSSPCSREVVDRGRLLTAKFFTAGTSIMPPAKQLCKKIVFLASRGEV